MGLMNYINGDYENPIFAIAFSSKEKLLDYLKENELDVLLISEEALEYEDIEKHTSRLNVVRLTKEHEKRKENNYIYKYSKAETIQSEIIRAYKAAEADSKSDLFRTVAVISPIGRSGKTELSKAICCLDEVRGGLYVGMEAYGEYTETDLHNMSDIVYLIKIRSEEITEYLEKYIISENGFAGIASSKTYLDIKELDKADMDWFIKVLIKWGRYTSIVFDVDGAALSDISILALFDDVIVPVLRDKTSENKLRSFRHLLEVNELGKTAGRLKEVEVPNVLYDNTEMLKCAGRLVES